MPHINSNQSFIETPSPLADRMRPLTIDDIVGHSELIGDSSPIRSIVENKNLASMIFWGPPGVGKTTIALALANTAGYSFYKLSAIDSGVKEIREIIGKGREFKKRGEKLLLFIDEIHRFNKNQQDALLGAVEKGEITLVGATTENPSFEVNSALLSRCQIYRLTELSRDDIAQIVRRALETDDELIAENIEIENFDFLIDVSGGDARSALNALELAVKIAKSKNGKKIITKRDIERALQSRTAKYDKGGEEHYNTISAFIKSLRGSDPDAALLWMAKMIDSGENPLFIARRMVVFASEDIGNADPTALTLAVSVYQAVHFVGMPEARIMLGQGATYLASAPKSNSSYIGINSALQEIERTGRADVPLHLRNAPTQYMKSESYGKDYKYPHDFEGHFVKENYFPIGYRAKAYYKPGVFGREKVINERLNILWGERYREESTD